MPVFNRNRHSGSSGVAAAYTIDNSIRLDKGSSAFMTKTWGSAASSATTMTFSWWQKRCGTGAIDYIFNAAGATDGIQINAANQHYLEFKDGSNALKTTQLYRDPSAWGHIVYRIDTTDSTGGDRFRLYQNGVEVTAFATDNNMSEDDVTAEFLVDTEVNQIGANGSGAGFADMYLAEFIICDGQSLGADSFGESDTNGNWVPIDPSGLTFGNNGFWLDFAVAPGTGNGAGTDVSGNANHFTDSGLAANDQTTDSPSDSAADDVGNFATWSALSAIPATSGTTLSDGNLSAAHASASYVGRPSSIPIPATGKWAFKIKITGSVGGSNDGGVGLAADANGNPRPTSGTGHENTNWYNCLRLILSNGDLRFTWAGSGGSTHYSGSALATNDIVEFLVDRDSATIDFEKNGSTYASQLTSIPTGDVLWVFHSLYATSVDCIFNYTPSDTSYKTLCTANLPAPTITDPSKYFQVDTFTGTGSELVRTLTDAAGDAFKPDIAWGKDRDSAVDHVLVDSARGATKDMHPNENSTAEQTTAEGLKSFDTSGYTLGTDVLYNASSGLQVFWLWATQGGAGSSNEDGSINTTTTSVNTTSLISASVFTGTGANATVGHGLGVIPDLMYFTKTAPSADEGVVYHSSNTAAPEDRKLLLHSTAGSAAAASNYFQSTPPTSSLAYIGSSSSLNASGATVMMYCMAGVEGYSKFGSYEGNNNADGPFIWCGFRPRWIMCKEIDTGNEQWVIRDSARDTYNPTDVTIYADVTNTEASIGTGRQIDFLSNGFKIRSTASQTNNASTFIYVAFAEFPSGGDGVSQARAR